MNKISFCLLMLACCAQMVGPLGAQELSWGRKALKPQVLLPDGTEFKTWQPATDWSKTYHVAQNHPQASDQNPGTRQKPFKTIGKAAEVLQPGQRVWVHSGIYRETIRPPRGGTGPSQMIGYQAAPGEEVIVSGSKYYPGQWKTSFHRDDEFSQTMFMTELKDDFFPKKSPFKVVNADARDIEIMPWAKKWAGRSPYTLRRGMVFQNGRRLTQMTAYEDVAKQPGAFWVDSAGTTLHLRPFADQDPNQARIELAVHQQLFKPRKPGLGYIHLKGLIFERAANGFPRTGVGAVDARGGHHWLIEHLLVRKVNSVGIEIGGTHNERIAHPRQALEDTSGYHIVRKNTLYNCGTGGIQGHTVHRCLVERNHLHHIGWQYAERYWETAAIKLLLNTETLVRRNHIHDIVDAKGIWMDWQNRNIRVCRNWLHDIITTQGAIFIEASQVPNAVDHNVIYNVRGSGVYVWDGDELEVSHNFMAACDEALFAHRTNNHRGEKGRRRKVGGRPSTAQRNKVFNNILLDLEERYDIGNKKNHADHNLIGTHYGRTPLPDSLKQAGYDRHSPSTSQYNWTLEGKWLTLDIRFEGNTFGEKESVPQGKKLDYIRYDYWGRPYGEQRHIGPFGRLPLGKDLPPRFSLQRQAGRVW